MSATPDHECRIVALAIEDQGGESLTKAISRGVRAEHFTDPACREIYRATCEMFRLGRPVAAWSVAEWMRDHGTLEEIGGAPVFADRTGNPPTSAHFAADLDRLLDEHALHVVRLSCLAALEIVKAPDAGDPATRLDEIKPHLRAALGTANPAKVRDMGAISEAAALELEAEKARGLTGPFPAWDTAAGEIMPGNLIVAAARTGVGKTSLGLQYAWGCISEGKPCTVFSLEMTAEEICQRLARQKLGADASHRELAAWIRGNLGRNCGLKVHDASTCVSLPQIEALARLDAASANGPGLIVVDYLQLVSPPRELQRENRERQVAAVSRALKLLAGELRVPVMLLSQLNRECEKEDRRPRLTDLRESGAIEQDADAVWFIHPDTSGPKIIDSNFAPLLLIQAKRRGGPAGIATKLQFEKAAVRFLQVDD